MIFQKTDEVRRKKDEGKSTREAGALRKRKGVFRQSAHRKPKVDSDWGTPQQASSWQSEINPLAADPEKMGHPEERLEKESNERKESKKWLGGA